ncbi:hypothetical protein PGB90_001358 [Kerria lacca]|nr:ornithine decarboxylase [Kerria lacca]
MKFNCDENQVQIVDSDTDVIRVIRSITETGRQDAFFIFDVQEIKRKYNNWKEKFPRVIPYYAVKCNNNLFLLKILSSLGIGFNCVSKGEIKQILSLGNDPSRIVYTNPAKLSSHLRYAGDQGVDLITFDNESELHKIKALHQSAKLLLRFKCDAKISQVSLGLKFGCNSVTEAPVLLRVARTLNLEVVGVCFHVGSGCEPDVYRRAIATAHKLFELGKTVGFHMYVLDIGGGFPGHKGSSLDTIADIINETLEEYFPVDNNVNVISEPGRYFAESAFTLATLVYSKRVVMDPVTGIRNNMYYINDGVYGSFSSILYEKRIIRPIPLSDVQTREVIPSSILGPTCDSVDIIVQDIKFPNLNIGEWIIFENMGAYTISCVCSFNNFPIPRVFSILNESTLLHLKENSESLGEEFDLSFPHSLVDDFQLMKNWNENQQVHAIFPELLTLEGKCSLLTT